MTWPVELLKAQENRANITTHFSPLQKDGDALKAPHAVCGICYIVRCLCCFVLPLSRCVTCLCLWAYPIVYVYFARLSKCLHECTLELNDWGENGKWWKTITKNVNIRCLENSFVRRKCFVRSSWIFINKVVRNSISFDLFHPDPVVCSIFKFPFT